MAVRLREISPADLGVVQAAGLLLFVVLKRMTGEAWKSGFVAALFAVHPLHVPCAEAGDR